MDTNQEKRHCRTKKGFGVGPGKRSDEQSLLLDVFMRKEIINENLTHSCKGETMKRFVVALVVVGVIAPLFGSYAFACGPSSRKCMLHHEQCNCPPGQQPSR
jgi:hypothetical protein